VDQADGPRRSRAIFAGHALLVVLYAIAFHYDVRERDALSWMDPYQYYDFAVDLLNGSRRFDQFELPSVFPFFLLPGMLVEPSIRGALWFNLVSTLLLCWSIHRLCLQLSIRTPSPWVAALVLSSPLALGLSRSLYVEYTLTALVATTFVAWIRLQGETSGRNGALFGGLLALGFMTKMTFPLFVALPVTAAVVHRLVCGRRDDALLLVAAAALPLVLVLAIQAAVFPTSFAYYQSLGNTAIPIARLIGPPDRWSQASLLYYANVLVRFVLGALAPLLAVAIWTGWRDRLSFDTGVLGGRRAVLWLWLLGPLILLIVPLVKEPRHALPCLVPGVLLIVIGIEALPRPRIRRAAMAFAVVLAALQFSAVFFGAIETPHYIDGPLHLSAIEAEMQRARPGPDSLARDARTRALDWRYQQNIATDGLTANESLAAAWHFFPAVTFDIATVASSASAGRAASEPESIAFRRFEDLYIFSALNTYNRRSGGYTYYETVPREQVIAHADFVLARGLDTAARERRYPTHTRIATIGAGDDAVDVLRGRGPTTPYRALYARRFLMQNPSLVPEERRLVAAELLISSALARNAEQVAALQREFQVIRGNGSPHRNIYWIGGYGDVIDLADRWIRSQPRN
jgi:hypothetical protein